MHAFKVKDKVVSDDGRCGTVIRSNYDTVSQDEDGEYVERDMIDVCWDEVDNVNGLRFKLVSVISASDVELISEDEWNLRNVMDS